MSTRKHIGVVMLILGVAAVCELLATILLGRELAPAAFGEFKFIHTIVILLSGVLVLGQNISLIRTLGNNAHTHYDWKSFIRRFALIAAGLGLFVLILIGFGYQLLARLPWMFVAFCLAVGIEFYSAVLRSQGRFRQSMLVTKMQPILFLGILAGLWLSQCLERWSWLLSGYVTAFAVAFGLAIWLLRRFPSGQNPLPPAAVKDGLWLFLITVSSVIMSQIDLFFIAKMLDYGQLAGYAAVNALTRGFELLAVAVWFVMMPLYAKDKSRSPVRDSLKALAAAAAMVVFYWFLGRPLLHWFFAGKFDFAAVLIGIFVASGVFKVIYNIPAGIISGRFPASLLRTFLWTNLAGIALNMAGNWVLIPRLGLTGAAYATLGSWVFRTVAAYAIVGRERAERAAA